MHGFISDGGVLTAWNNCKMRKSCYSSHPMRITIDISRWCIIYAMQSWSTSSNRYELAYSGMHIIWSKHWSLKYFRRSRLLKFFIWFLAVNLCVCIFCKCILGMCHTDAVLSLTSCLFSLCVNGVLEFCLLCKWVVLSFFQSFLFVI